VYDRSDQVVHIHVPRGPALAWLHNIDATTYFHIILTFVIIIIIIIIINSWIIIIITLNYC
jgi:hypothetical protein